MINDTRDEIIDARSLSIVRRMFSSDFEHESLAALNRFRARMQQNNIPLNDLVVTFKTAARDKATSLMNAQATIDELREECNFYKKHLPIEIIRSYHVQRYWTEDYAEFYDLVCLYFGTSDLPYRWPRKIADLLKVEVGEIGDWEEGGPIPDGVVDKMRALAEENDPQAMRRRTLIARITKGTIDDAELQQLCEDNASAVEPTEAEHRAVKALRKRGFPAKEIATILSLPIAAIWEPQSEQAQADQPRPEQKKPKKPQKEAPSKLSLSPKGEMSSLPPEGVRERGALMDADELLRINGLFRKKYDLRYYAGASGQFTVWVDKQKPPKMQQWMEVFRNIYRHLVDGGELSEEWVDQMKREEGLSVRPRSSDEKFEPFTLEQLRQK